MWFLTKVSKLINAQLSVALKICFGISMIVALMVGTIIGFLIYGLCVSDMHVLWY